MTTMSPEEQLYYAVRLNDVPKVTELLQQEEIDINWANTSDYSNTALHMACKRGHHAIVKLLLHDPRIFVNSKNLTGGTPFHTACSFHSGDSMTKTDAVQLLLDDPRVDVDAADSYGASPFWLACFWGHAGVLKCMIASGREINFMAAGKSLASGKNSTPLEIAHSMGKVAVVDWLKKYFDEPEKTTSEARIQLGQTAIVISHLFALGVMVSDEYFAVRETAAAGMGKYARFFEIMTKLPLELQMILAHRMYHSSRTLVLSKDSEPAFKKVLFWRESLTL